MVFVFVPKAQQSNAPNRSLPLGEKLRHMDFIGTVLFLGLVCCVLLALTWGGQRYSWSDSRIIGLFTGFGLLTTVFCAWMWRRGDFALIPPRVVRQRSISVGAVALFGIYMAVNVVGIFHKTLGLQFTQPHILTS